MKKQNMHKFKILYLNTWWLATKMHKDFKSKTSKKMADIISLRQKD